MSSTGPLTKSARSIQANIGSEWNTLLAHLNAESSYSPPDSPHQQQLPILPDQHLSLPTYLTLP